MKSKKMVLWLLATILLIIGIIIIPKILKTLDTKNLTPTEFVKEHR